LTPTTINLSRQARDEHRRKVQKNGVSYRESILSWMQGHGPVPPSVLAAGAQLLTIEEVARLGALIETSESETERVGSAYKLGAAIRQPGAVGDGAMDCLLGCMVHGEERVRRAATWGIGAFSKRFCGHFPQRLVTTVDLHSTYRPKGYVCISKPKHCAIFCRDTFTIERSVY
jgi:hypothetical protein